MLQQTEALMTHLLSVVKQVAQEVSQAKGAAVNSATSTRGTVRPRELVEIIDGDDAMATGGDCAPPSVRLRAKVPVETPCILPPSLLVLEGQAGHAASSDSATPVPQLLG